MMIADNRSPAYLTPFLLRLRICSPARRFSWRRRLARISHRLPAATVERPASATFLPVEPLATCLQHASVAPWSKRRADMALHGLATKLGEICGLGTRAPPVGWSGHQARVAARLQRGLRRAYSTPRQRLGRNATLTGLSTVSPRKSVRYAGQGHAHRPQGGRTDRGWRGGHGPPPVAAAGAVRAGAPRPCGSERPLPHGAAAFGRPCPGIGMVRVDGMGFPTLFFRKGIATIALSPGIAALASSG